MGDMEMDLILGASGSEAILTLTDRKTDYTSSKLFLMDAKPNR